MINLFNSLVVSSIGSVGSPKRRLPSVAIRFPHLALRSIKSFSKVLSKNWENYYHQRWANQIGLLSLLYSISYTGFNQQSYPTLVFVK